ncbi:MAG TPA: Holliday junction resolvase RuvX [Erysipelothrix sp.]
MSKALGLDLGSKTCGVAVSDGLNLYAHPLVTLYYETDVHLLLEPLANIIKEHRINHIALGYPKMMNNDIGERAQISLDFKALLETTFDLPVTLIDERLTSVYATKQLIQQDVSRKKRKKIVDQLAAVHILQTYLDQKQFMEGSL